MALRTLSIPLVPGKTDAFREFAAQLQVPKRPQQEEALERAGVEKNWRGYVQLRAYVQAGRNGDFVIYTMKGVPDVIHQTFRRMGTSNEPHDRWFRERMRELHGIDIAEAESLPVSSQRYKLRERFELKTPEV